MPADPILISSDVASRVFVAAEKTYIKNTMPKIGFPSMPLLELAESVKEGHSVSGTDGAINDGITTLPDLNSQFWSGDDTIIDPQDINGDIRFETTYARHVIPWQLRHDEWLRKGFDIVPHMDGDLQTKAKAVGKPALQKLHDNLLQYDMEKLNSAFNNNHNLALWKQGASAKEFVGINAILPLAPVGTLYAQDRGLIPQMRHFVRGSTQATMLDDLQGLFREMTERAANSGMTGEWTVICGGIYQDVYAKACKAAGFQFNADVSGIKKIDGVIKDSALSIGGLKPIYDPTLAKLDSVASSEAGLAISAAVVTFSGGGATRQATGLAMVNASGAVTAIIIVDPGRGYTSAPTMAVAGGAGLNTQSNIYSTTSGTGRIVVAADDFRVGQLASVTVNAGGTGFAAGVAAAFDRRAYFIFKPGLKYKPAKGGNGLIERRITVPADAARTRKTEVQMETVAYWYHRAPNLCAVHYVL